ncbi:NAD-dependent epimerase/dehydratase family protein [Algoriphagus namhaensis]
MSASKKSFTKESKILILGGNGYLGSHLLSALHRQGYHSVKVGSRNAEGKDALKLDLTASEVVSKIQEEQFDFIFNLTGQISRPIHSCLEQNTTGINHLIAASQGQSKLIQFSTVGVYGGGEMADEDSPCEPETPYSTLKLVAENLIQNNIPADQRLILRLSNIYGSSQPKGVFAYLLRSGLSDQILDFNNDGSMTRSFLHVEDFAEATVTLMEKYQWGNDSPVLNLVGPDCFSLQELIDTFEQELGFRYQRNFDPVKPYDNMKSISDKAFRSLSGYQDKYRLKAYIKSLV